MAIIPIYSCILNIITQCLITIFQQIATNLYLGSEKSTTTDNSSAEAGESTISGSEESSSTTTVTTNNSVTEGETSSGGSSTNTTTTDNSSAAMASDQGSVPGIEENLLQINVYYNSLNEQKISAEIVYPFGGSAFASAFGGVMSLYLGIPIAMLFELIEIVLDFIGNFFNWTSGKPLGRKSLIF